MNYIRKLKKGKSQVIKNVAFCTLLNNTLPDADKSIIDLLAEFDKEVNKVDDTVSKDALNNVHGDWYEWLLAIAAWNHCSENENSNLALLTPNVQQFKIASLYNEKLYNLINDLRNKVLAASSVQLISSNPDFVIIDRKLVNQFLPKILKISIINEEAITTIENTYREFIGKCDFDDIIGYISVKTSFRPDRRLQIPHEGSLMKAIYTHLQTREWIISPKGLKNFAIATNVGIHEEDIHSFTYSHAA